MKEQLINLLKAFGNFILMVTIVVTILAIPLKLIYVWGRFLWNLI